MTICCDVCGCAVARQSPTTLDELLVVVPGLRKLRSLDAAMLRVLLDRRRTQCTWCGQPVPRGRRTWCSDSCVSAFRARCDTAAQATLVLNRDRGICADCGRDTIAAAREAEAAWRQSPHYMAYRNWDQRRALFAQFGYARGRWREVDHVVPVIEGGGLMGPDNLRLLCGACHAQHTRALRKRIAQPGAASG